VRRYPNGNARQDPDPVARFHLGNGARIERINFYADPSAKGVRQSHGLMVNYLYDLKRIDKHRKQLETGEVPASSDVEDLYFNAWYDVRKIKKGRHHYGQFFYT